MGVYLNPGSVMFQEALRSMIHVDKSLLIEATNRHIGSIQKYICVSRPRRFGKTMAENMLAAYYGRGEDSRELFGRLKIAGAETFEKHLNRYHVIRVDMHYFLSKTDSVDAMLKKLQRDIIYDLREAFGDIRYRNPDDMSEMMMDVYSRTQCGFVILIDEWDCLFRDYQNDLEAQKNLECPPVTHPRNIMKRGLKMQGEWCRI